MIKLITTNFLDGKTIPSPQRGNKTVYGSISGNFTFRNEKTIWFESTLERDFLYKMDYSRTVYDVIEQPVTVHYINSKGKESKYTPDYLVYYRSVFAKPISPMLVEVKPRDRLIKDKSILKDKFLAGIAFAKVQGWRFRIYDESRIKGVTLTNIRFLSRYKDTETAYYDPEEIKRISEHLEAMGHCPVEVLLANLYRRNEELAVGISTVWHLLSTKVFACDITLPLNMKSTIWINTEEKYS